MPIGHDLRHISGPADWAEAVAATDGPQLVLAGPGTGKTEFLARRVAHLLDSGHDPSGILVLTFSRRAASELERRILSRLATPVSGATASTFHSFAHRLLETRLGAEGKDVPVLLTGPEQVRLVGRLLSQEERGRWPVTFRSILESATFADEVADFVMRCHERLLGPAELADLAAGRADWRALPHFLHTYQQALESSGRIDYGTLVAEAVRIAAEEGERFTHVVVDEFQDTSPAQARLAELAAGAGGNLTVAADPHQSIYSFRGAEIENVSDFADRHADHATFLVLAESFRVPAAILAAAERLVAGNDRSRASDVSITPAPHAGEVDVLTFDQRSAEAEWIAAEVERIHVAERLPLRSIAVVVRSTRHLLPELSRALDRRKLRHDRPDTRLADHPAIRIVHDVVVAATAPPGSAEMELAMRRLLLGPLVALSLGREREVVRRRLREGIGWGDLLRIEVSGTEGLADLIEDGRWATALPAVDGFWHVWDRLPGLEWIVADPARADFRTAWSTFARMLERQAERDPSVTLAASLDASMTGDFEASPLLSFTRPNEDRLVVTTLHQAKGLEFEVVFVADAVEGVFPDTRRARSLLRPELLGRVDADAASMMDARLAEERRLAYTATTRARRRVVWTATTAGIDEGERRPSRFLLAAADASTFDEIGPPALRRDDGEFAPLTLTDAEARLRRLITDPAIPSTTRLAALQTLVAGTDHWAPQFFAGVPEPGPDTGLLGSTVRLSPTQATLYAECPRRYALERRLRALEAESPYLLFGSIVHEVLELAEQRAMDDGLPHADVDTALGVLDEVWSRDAAFGPPPIDEAWHRRAVTLVTQAYEDWPGGEARPVSLEVQLDTTLGEVDWTGRADRVELGPNGLRIVDYKTSKNPPPKKDAAASLQLGYYLLAAAEDPELSAVAEPAEAQLWYPLAGSVLDFDMANLDAVRDTLVEVSQSIVAEDWTPRVGKQCERCQFRGVCPAWPDGREAYR